MSKQSSIRSFFVRETAIAGNDGSSSPKKKKTTEDDENPPNPREARKFQQKWLSSHSWLTYDDKKNQMFCTLCIKTDKTNAFTFGTNNFRTSTITRHISSNDHMLSVCSNEQSGDLKKSIEKQLSDKETAIVAAMKCVYFMVKQGHASSGYGNFVEFMQFMNCPDIDNLYCGSNASYTSIDIAYVFQDSIAAVISKSVDETLSQSPCISILANESTDNGVTKKLVVYVRAVEKDLTLVTMFLGNMHVIDGKAETITCSLLDLLKSRNINIDSVFGFGSDGAAVTTSTKQGVTGRLQSLNPKLVNIHCLAHRLALATSQAAEKVSYLKEFQEMLTSLYYYFKRSSVRNEKLKAIQELLNEPQMRCKEVHAVRWLSFFKALETVYLTWDSLVTYFAQVQDDPTMKGFNKKLTKFEFLATVYMMMDVMPHVMELCLVFQTKYLDLTVVDPALRACKSHLENYLSGEMNSLKDTHLNKLQQAVESGKGSFKGHKLAYTERAKQTFKATMSQFISNLIANLNTRFPEKEENLVSCLSCFGLRPLSFLNKEELATWGDSKLKVLVEHYGSDEHSPAFIDKDKAQHEWKLLKSVVLQEQYPCDQLRVLWSLINRYHQETFPNLIKLAALALTLPIHTADCERGFSVQNSIKTPERNRMGPGRLNTLMTIAVQGPPYKDFNFQASMCEWKEQKSRRLFSSAKKDN